MNILKKEKKNTIRKITYKNMLLCILILFLTCFLSYGYAYLETNVELSSNIYIGKMDSPVISEISTFGETDGGVEESTPLKTTDSVSMYSILPNINSTITYKIIINNQSATAMFLNRIHLDSNSNDNVVFSMMGIDSGDKIESMSNVEVYITVKYNDSLTNVPLDTTSGIVLKFVFSKELKYVDDNSSKVVDLESLTEDKNSGIWQDTFGNDFVLNGVSYDDERLYHVFGTSSYAKATKSFIPSIGDFAIEVYFETPSSFSTNEDQAIISQVSDSSNSTGRFKMNIRTEKKGETSPTLSFFYNSTSSGKNNTIFAYKDVLTSTKYCMQIVRLGGKISIYVNGIYINSNDVPVEDVLSPEITKLGKWTNSDNQSFKGKIYAVRIYNNALSDEELYTNYKVDNELYSHTPSSLKKLYDYALANQVVTNNDGLYKIDDTKYAYKGIEPSNFININGKIWRILSFNSDGTMKLLGIDYEQQAIPYDEGGSRKDEATLYCKRAAEIATDGTYYGCNAWNSTSTEISTLGSESYISTGTVIKDATINTFMNTTVYDSFDAITRNLINEHEFDVGVVGLNSTIANGRTEAEALKWNGKVGMLTAVDVIDSNTSIPSNIQTGFNNSSYIFKMSSNNKYIWTMNRATSNTWDVLTLISGNQIGGRKSSRTAQSPAIFYAYPTIYISSNMNVTGHGLDVDPFVYVSSN